MSNVQNCPRCNALLNVSNKLTIAGVVTVVKKSIAAPTVRKLSVQQKRLIIANNILGWPMTKEKFAKRHGVSTKQIGAVIAWTHKNLGGKRYATRCLKAK